MRAFLTRHIIGVLAFDEKGKMLSHRLFNKNPEEIADKLSRDKAIPEESEIIQDLLKKGYNEIVWDKRDKVKGVKTVYEGESIAQRSLNEQFRKTAIDLRWIASQADLNVILTQVNVLRTKTKLREPKPDILIMRVVGVIGELEQELNTLCELLREWYGLYFPEAVHSVKSNERLIKIVKYGRREDIPEQDMKAMIKKTAGFDLGDQDIEALVLFATRVEDLFSAKENISKYLEQACSDTMPNTSALAGPVLAARMLSLAGGLEKMARMPSSTIQLLGAEKALFRHLREKTKSPKYGILFTHPHIQKAPDEKRGKIARLIAAKLSLAVRVDFFSKDDRSKKMKKELDDAVSQVLA